MSCPECHRVRARKRQPINRTLLEKAERIMTLLKRSPELDPGMHGRLVQISRAVLRGDQSLIAPDRPDFPVVLQGIRDLSEINFILDVLGEKELVAQPLSVVREVFRSDHPLPSEAVGITPGRDRQLEYFVRAIMQRGGLRPIPRASDADFEVKAANHSLVVEIKRLKSFDRLAERVRDAADQITATGLPGIVCIDISRAVGPDNSILVRPAQTDLRRAQVLRMKHLLRERQHVLAEAIGDRHVVGLEFIDSLIVQHGLRGDRATGEWSLEHLFDNVYWPLDAPRHSAAEAFFERFMFGLPRYHPMMYWKR